jgi:hypothetical protein
MTLARALLQLTTVVLITVLFVAVVIAAWEPGSVLARM